ncbi:MAG: tetratricopeptide repeat protein [Kordiimonadaceae bacterium]|nr:tetratricopeptide repeat protein [Kordiimonadaceae bacterium]
MKYLDAGEIDKAHQVFMSYAPPYKNIGRSYIAMAKYLGKSYRPSLLKIAYEKNPNDWHTIIEYANALLETDVVESDKLFYKAIENGLLPVDCPPQFIGEISFCGSKYEAYRLNRWHYKQNIDAQINFFKRNLEIFPDNLKLQYELAQLLYKKGDFDEALKVAANVSAKSDNGYEAQYLYLSYLYNLGYTDKLFAELPRILKIKNQEFHRLNGGALSNFILFSEEKEETQKLLLKITETFPTNPYVQMSYGMFMEYKGKLNEAEKYYRKSVPLMDTFDDLRADFLDNSRFSQGLKMTPELRKIWIGKSRKVLNRYIDEMIGSIIYNPYSLVRLDNHFEGLSDTHIQKLYDKERNKPDVKPVLFHVFADYFERNNVEVALKIIKEGIEKFPKERWLYVSYIQIADILTASQRKLYGINITELKENFFHYPPSKSDWLPFNFEKNITDEELEFWYKMRLSEYSNNFYAYLYYSNFLKKKGRLDEANNILDEGEVVLRKHLKNHPTDADMVENFAFLLRDKGKINEATHQFKKLSKMENGRADEVLLRKVYYTDQLVLVKDWKGMIKAFFEYLQLFKQTQKPWDVYYGRIKGRVEEALIFNNEVSGIDQLIMDEIKKYPNLSQPYEDYGVYFLKKGKTEYAREMFNKAYDDDYRLLEYLRDMYFKELDEGNVENVQTLKSVIQKIIEMKL